MKLVLKDYSLAVAGFKFTELNILSAGTQKCEPGYKYGPAVRNHYLIHYITNGKGILGFDNKEFAVNAGQAFLIEPGCVTYYEADRLNPWEYIWVGFDGSYVKGLLETADIVALGC